MIVYANDDGLIPIASYCGSKTLDLILVEWWVGEEVCWGAAQNIFLVIVVSKRKCFVFWISLCYMGHLELLGS